jgi:transcriptional regulator GlxA family with amidase domain
MRATAGTGAGASGGGMKGFTVDSRVVVDRDAKLVTSRGPGTAIEFALACVAVLAGGDKAAEVARPMVMHEGYATAEPAGPAGEKH